MNERRDATLLGISENFTQQYDNILGMKLIAHPAVNQSRPPLVRWVCDGTAQTGVFRRALNFPHHLPSRCYQWQMVPGFISGGIRGPIGLGEASVH